jgi:hypothetical protein
LHNVLESECDRLDAHAPAAPNIVPVLPSVVEFLDHFDTSLEVVVGCARKTEMARWNYLFDVVGNPRDLFEVSAYTHTTKYSTHVDTVRFV